MRVSTRVAAIPPYFFADLGRRIAETESRGLDVIRMDMGAPDLPPAPHIIEALVEAARRPDAHSYTPFGGTPGFRQAIATFYGRRFGVEIDPQREAVALIGSKEGLFNIMQAFVDPGDVVLVPDPGYPVYATGAAIAGAEVVAMPLKAANGFLPDLDAVRPEHRARAKLMWLNYPNNPTGATADLEFFRLAVEFARRHDILLCHDAAYSEVGFDGYHPPSVLQVPGAMEVSVEFNTLSKAYNMAGWRLGMAIGRAQAIQALHTLKSQIDTSIFLPIMEAGRAALTGDQSWLEDRNATYVRRRDTVLEGLQRAGLRAAKPKAALYVWAELNHAEPSSADYCERMLQEIGVSVTPGVAFGAQGEGYVRISLATPNARIEQAMERWAVWERARAEGRSARAV